MATTYRRRLAAATTAALLVAGLAACQTGTETAEPTEPAPTLEPEAPAEPEETEETEDQAEGTTDEPAAPEETEGEAGSAEAGLAVNGPNAIHTPAPGDTVPGPDVTVAGEGTAYEATLNYHVLDAESTEVVVDVDYTMAGANGEVGPWEIGLSLEPGRYTVQVWEPEIAGEGEGGAEPYINLVEVTFTVE